jgi:hypothetical protein
MARQHFPAHRWKHCAWPCFDAPACLSEPGPRRQNRDSVARVSAAVLILITGRHSVHPGRCAPPGKSALSSPGRLRGATNPNPVVTGRIQQLVSFAMSVATPAWGRRRAGRGTDLFSQSTSMPRVIAHRPGGRGSEVIGRRRPATVQECT